MLTIRRPKDPHELFSSHPHFTNQTSQIKISPNVVSAILGPVCFCSKSSTCEVVQVAPCASAETKKRYRLSDTLIGHVAPINCLVFLQGDVLASGGNIHSLSQQYNLTFSQGMTKSFAYGISRRRKQSRRSKTLEIDGAR